MIKYIHVHGTKKYMEDLPCDSVFVIIYMHESRVTLEALGGLAYGVAMLPVCVKVAIACRS